MVRRSGDRPRSTLRQRLPGLAQTALALGSIALALLLVEGVLRVVHFTRRFEQSLSQAWPWLVADPVVGFKNQPGHVSEYYGFKINSLGFRGDEIEVRKPSGIVRVACLGDSTTFGVWKEGLFRIRGHTSYPQELAKLLRQDGLAHVEVINAGVMGSMTAHGLRMLLARLLPLRPDVITLRYGNNEHAPGHDQSGWEWTPVASLLPSWAYDWELVRLGFHVFGTAFPLSPPGRRPRQLSVDQFRRNLYRFVALGRDNGIKLLLLDFPYRPIELGESPGVKLPNLFSAARNLKELHDWHEEYQEVLRSVAQEAGTPLLETARQFRESPTPLFTEYDLSHPNEAGAQLLARLLRDKLQSLGWLGPGR
jgi:lysophospholipase L1-like esterase